MRPAYIIGAVVLVVVAGALAFPAIAKMFSRNAALSRCAQLKEQRAALAVQGGDVVALAQLDAQIRACSQEAQSLGASIDLGDVTLAACVSKQEQIEQEWAHYRSTQGEDAIKRNNTRGTIHRLGEEMARCYVSAINDADSVASLDNIRRALGNAIAKSEERDRCWRNGGAGCSRYGLNEPFPPESADVELQRVTTPLRAAYAQAGAKRDSLRAVPLPTPMGAP